MRGGAWVGAGGASTCPLCDIGCCSYPQVSHCFPRVFAHSCSATPCCLRSYTVLARTGTDWLPVDGKANQDAGTLAGDASQRYFEIAGLDPGRYKVQVWGEITHPNNGETADVTSSEVTSAGDYRSFPSHMRDGVIGVGTPGEKPASGVGTRGLQVKWGACGWHYRPPGWWHIAAAALTLHVAVTARPMHCSQRPPHLCCWSYPVAPMSAGTPQVTFSASISDMTMRITGLDGPDNGKLGSSPGLEHRLNTRSGMPVCANCLLATWLACAPACS